MPAVRAAGGVGVCPTAAASRRVGPPELFRATYFASRIALWASALLIVGSLDRAYDASLTPLQPADWTLTGTTVEPASDA
jgi:hypothetical protein